MVNSTKLNERIREEGFNQTEIAAQMGIAQSTLNGKINNVRPFFLEEAELLQEILGIPDSEFRDYFFYHGVA